MSPPTKNWIRFHILSHSQSFILFFFLHHQCPNLVHSFVHSTIRQDWSLNRIDNTHLPKSNLLSRLSTFPFHNWPTSFDRVTSRYTSPSLRMSKSYEENNHESHHNNEDDNSDRNSEHSKNAMDMDLDMDDDHDNEYIDSDTLGDWILFRQSLVSRTQTKENHENECNSLDGQSLTSTHSKDPNDSHQREILSSMNQKELSSKQGWNDNQHIFFPPSQTFDRWAHAIPYAKIQVGTLLVRLPLEAELYRRCQSDTKSPLSLELQRRVQLKNNSKKKNNIIDRTNMVFSSSSSSFASTTTSSSSYYLTPEKTFKLSVSVLAARTLWWYHKARALIDQEIQEISSHADERGQINPAFLNVQSQELLDLYLDNQESFQEVRFVLQREVDEPSVSRDMSGAKLNKTNNKASVTTLILNRPMAKRLTDSLARLVLFGAYAYGQLDMTSSSSSDDVIKKNELLIRFIQAFRDHCFIYVGGPDAMDQPAILIHGFSDLVGARKLYPGTGIYQGGVEAAIQGVLSGHYRPQDFRFFVGRHECGEGHLESSVMSHKYQPVSCARNIVLNQCTDQCLKPLWYDVMEMCGGELKEISALEYANRNDFADE